MKPGAKRRNGKYGDPAWMRRISKLRKYENYPKGEAHPMAKLIAGQVAIIRHPKHLTRTDAKRLARRYGISEGYVYHLRARRRWKHI